ncbi:MAG: peptidoglycan endopeptidase [Treponema sp.]|nr:peptidoglycan endopeptidase [Treponema sp.]
MNKKNTLFFVMLFIVISCSASDPGRLAAFSDPAAIWGNGKERFIEEAYRSGFRTRIIGGRIMNIRIPFAQNNERDVISDIKWDFIGGGKGNPDTLWPVIDRLLNSDDFARYVETLSGGNEQVIIFDIPNKTWRSSRDLFDLAHMKAGSYRGLPHRPYFLVTGKGITEADVYNYLYCVGHIGMDCSGFVWYVLSYAAQRGGVDLGSSIGPSMGIPRGADPAWYAGTAFFNSQNSNIVAVEDTISNLRPADIILFRDETGAMSHSVIIQSVNMTQGVIRYVQNTSVAPLHERGVHESFIYFNPANPNVSLRDPSLRWTQRREAPFPGEMAVPFADDGERYRASRGLGGGRVVRIRQMSLLTF